MKAKLLGRITEMKRGQTADFCQIVLNLTGNAEGPERTGKAAKMDAVLQVSPQFANLFKFGTEVVINVEIKEDAKPEIAISLPSASV